MVTSDVDGIKVCGVLFEAGDKQSETLLKVGNEKQKFPIATTLFALVMCTLE